MAWLFALARLLGGCGVAAAFGYLGYDLYVRGVQASSDVEIAYQSARFWVSGGAPGVFFILSAVVVAIVTLTRRVNLMRDGDQRHEVMDLSP